MLSLYLMSMMSLLRLPVYSPKLYWAVLQLHGEGERKLAAGIDITHEDGGKGTAGFGTQIPVLHDGRHLVHPRHGNGVAGDVDDNQILVRLGKCGDNGI